MKTALKEEQSKSIQMGTVVKYLEKTKEELEEKFKLAMQNNAKEVSFFIICDVLTSSSSQVQKVQETSLQMKELSIKLLEAEKKKAEVEATLVLREKQVRVRSLGCCIKPLCYEGKERRRQEVGREYQKYEDWR